MSKKEELFNAFLTKSVEKGVEKFTNDLQEKSKGIVNFLDKTNLTDVKLVFNKEKDRWIVNFEDNNKVKEGIEEAVIGDIINRLSTPGEGLSLPTERNVNELKQLNNLLQNFIVRI